MQITPTRESQDPTDELDALIEEARRRAHKRRLVAAAAVALTATGIGGSLLFFGGGDGGGESGSAGSGGPSGSGPANEANAPASTSYRCPSSVRELRAGPPPGRGVPGCKVRILADLPEGWVQSQRNITVFPTQTRALQVDLSAKPFAEVDHSLLRRHTAGRIALFLGNAEVKFANFPVGNSLRPGADLLPPGGMRLSLAPAASGPGFRSAQAEFEPQDFSLSAGGARNTSQMTFTLDGIDFDVKTEIAARKLSPDLIPQANAIIDSLSTRQKLCPCANASEIRPTLQRLDENSR